MNFKKILLVGINSQFVHSNLAIRYLEKSCKLKGIDIYLKEFTINQRVENIVRDIYEVYADLICFSAYIWNIEFILKVSKTLKTINPDIIILCGGPEVSFDSKEYLLNSSFDFIIEGEGEDSFLEFIESFKDEKKLREVKGLYSKFDKEIFYPGKRQGMKMDDVVFPYDNTDDLENRILYYESSRGCPFRCSYCLSSVSSEVRFKDTNKVKEELNFFIGNKVKLVKFVDRTFNCNPKFACDIWRYLIELYNIENYITSFHFEISADLFTKEELELLSTAPKGLFQFEIGVQTTNSKVIKNINRKMDILKLKENVTYLKNNTKINIHLDLIAGLPGEDKESFIHSFNEVYLLFPNKLQLGFLKLIKGSLLNFEKEKWGIKHNEFPPYEIILNDDISFHEILEFKLVEEVLDKYYNSGKFNLILKFLSLKFKNPYDMYLSLALYFKEKGVFNRNISNEEYYIILYDFVKDILKEDEYIIKDLVRFQYLYFDKKKVDRLFYKEDSKDDIRAVQKKVGNGYFVSKFKVDILRFKETSEIYIGEYLICFNKNNLEDINYFCYT